jgi:hypothetical protein
MMLIIRDACYPSWKASVGGSQTVLLAAEVAGRAVQVPAGEHVVVRHYDAASFRLGLAVSAASFVGVVGWFVGSASWLRLNFASARAVAEASARHGRAGSLTRPATRDTAALLPA